MLGEKVVWASSKPYTTLSITIVYSSSNLTKRSGQYEVHVLTYPPVWEYPDKVLRGQRFKHWHKELDHMLISCKFTLEQEVLMMQDGLTVHILHQDPEGFRVCVQLLLPLEI